MNGLMKTIWRLWLTACLLLTCTGAAFAGADVLTVTDLGGGNVMVRINTTKKYLILPVEDVAPSIRLSIIADNDQVDALDVRMAVNKIDYMVPVDISAYSGRNIVLRFAMQTHDAGHDVSVGSAPSVQDAAFAGGMSLSDTFDASNHERLRPAYHFSPAYGWMNDPNGLVYKDGEYHLFYQHNPYGSRWGNMNWGHAVSRDLTSWQHLPVAIAPDGLGAIFSGSAVVDTDNTAGFGAGAIVAIYTEASARQMQSIAYSTDNGRTFKKYSGNPVLTSDVADFRDPKVSWMPGVGRWIMVLAAGQEVRFYSSADLKSWTYESCFGAGQGAHGGVWECPDLFELPVEGTDSKKWVLIVNINPGGPFGGSATQYFTGQFDGHHFTADTPSMTKWMDYGKDHYATVTWNDAPQGRRVALAWMSNWQYANDVPTMQFRSANSIPRDLSLYELDGTVFLQSRPSDELLALRQEKTVSQSFTLKGSRSISRIMEHNDGIYEVLMTLRPQKKGIVGFTLENSKGEKVGFRLDTNARTLTFSREGSGDTGFSNEFAVPVAVQTEEGDVRLRIYVDRCSIETFVNDGRKAMTNIVFPSEPFNAINFYCLDGGTCQVKDLAVYRLAAVDAAR